VRFLADAPWCGVALGTVVLDPVGVPRTVVGNSRYDTHRTLILLEGDHCPHIVTSTALVTPVQLDDTDAVTILQRAGFTTEEI
jgi:hypothetical protein